MYSNLLFDLHSRNTHDRSHLSCICHWQGSLGRLLPGWNDTSGPFDLRHSWAVKWWSYDVLIPISHNEIVDDIKPTRHKIQHQTNEEFRERAIFVKLLEIGECVGAREVRRNYRKNQSRGERWWKDYPMTKCEAQALCKRICFVNKNRKFQKWKDDEGLRKMKAACEWCDAEEAHEELTGKPRPVAESKCMEDGDDDAHDQNGGWSANRESNETR